MLVIFFSSSLLFLSRCYSALHGRDPLRARPEKEGSLKKKNSAQQAKNGAPRNLAVALNCGKAQAQQSKMVRKEIWTSQMNLTAG